MGLRLLLVEDDVPTAALMANALRKRSHDVDVARDGRDALFFVGDAQYDAIILDRRLPLVDGIEVLKRLRSSGQQVPVILLTALGEMRNKIEGFEAGADDYLVKPVNIDELDARLRAVTRRTPPVGDPSILRAGTIKIELFKYRVTRAEVAVTLFGLEYGVLVTLVRNAYRVVTRRMLLEEVWGYDFDPSANVVDAQIARVRGKLNFGSHCDAITTVRGAGYMISEGA